MKKDYITQITEILTSGKTTGEILEALEALQKMREAEKKAASIKKMRKVQETVKKLFSEE